MADFNQQSLFSRLTRLFRSGPVVKRKIMNSQDRYTASAFEVFRKNQTHVYSNALSAYGTYDRMARYSDFSEMEYCLHGDTLIAVPGGYKKISDLAKECSDNPDMSFIVYSYDHNEKRIVPALGKQARQTRVDHAYTVTFDNGQKIIGTPNHRLMKRDGTYCKIEDLSAGDAMMPFYRKIEDGQEKIWDTKEWVLSSEMREIRDSPSHAVVSLERLLHAAQLSNFDISKISSCLDATEKEIKESLASFGFDDIETFRAVYFWQFHETVDYSNALFVSSIEYHGIIPLFDLTVDGYKNFATDTVISHNTPEIGSALDIYAEESVSPDENGNVLHIHSNNHRIRSLLTELFIDTLNVDFNLTPWARNLCKFGDHFLFNDVHPKHGVINAFPLPISEVQREEGFDPKDPMAVRFRWVTQGNQTLENWQVSHMRLLGNDAFIPYGSSVLEPARRIWRQLILLEDAMLVYRIVRAPERRVFKIDVGNIAPEDIPKYMEKAQSSLKKASITDHRTGRVDLRYNPMPVHKDTRVALLDGTEMSICQISQRMVNDPLWTPWVYSVQDGTHNVVPGKVVWCGKNYNANTLIKVWTSETGYITTAPEHPFILSSGEEKTADELEVGDSLMTVDRQITDRGYEKLTQPSGKKVSTHVMVARDVYAEEWKHTDKAVVHHKEPWKRLTNKLNNTPENLEVMNFWDHRKMHAEMSHMTLNHPELLEKRRIARIKFNQSPEKRLRVSELNRKLQKAQKMGREYNGSLLHKEHNVVRREAQINSWQDSKKERSEAMQWIIPNEIMKHVFDTVKKNSKIGRDDLTNSIRQSTLLMDLLRSANSCNKRNVDKFNISAVTNKLVRMGYIKKNNYGEMRSWALLNEAPINHQVRKIEVLTGQSDDVYCMTVVGMNGEEDRHNFGVMETGIEDKCLIMLKNSIDEDYFIPVRGGESGTSIDTLGGGTIAGETNDVEYIQKKLFAALKIPKAYLGYDEGLGAKATLAQEDIRFSRTIGKIQRTILAELNKIAIIHLYCNGFSDSDLLDFKVTLSNPSTIAQQQKLELIKSRFEAAQSALGTPGLVDKSWVQRNVLKLTTEEIRQIRIGRKYDKVEELDIESTTIAGAENGPDAPGMGGDVPNDIEGSLDLGALAESEGLLQLTDGSSDSIESSSSSAPIRVQSRVKEILSELREDNVSESMENPQTDDEKRARAQSDYKEKRRKMGRAQINDTDGTNFSRLRHTDQGAKKKNDPSGLPRMNADLKGVAKIPAMNETEDLRLDENEDLDKIAMKPRINHSILRSLGDNYLRKDVTSYSGVIKEEKDEA